MWDECVPEEIASDFARYEGCIDVFNLPSGLSILDRNDSRHRSNRENMKRQRDKARAARAAARGVLRCTACGAELSARASRGGVITCPAAGCWMENKAA